MKKLIFWMVLIVGTVVLLGSCAKKDDATTAATVTPFTSTTTAAGSITVGSVAMSGTYVSDCNTTGVAAAVSGGYFPSDIVANRDVLVVTGNDNVSQETHFYTDTTCSTLSGYSKNGWDNFTVGDASGDYYKVTYNEETFKVLAVTSTAVTFYETYFSTYGITNQGTAIDLSAGIEYSMSSNGNIYMNLYSVTSTTVQTGDDSSSTQPTAMDSAVMIKQ